MFNVNTIRVDFQSYGVNDFQERAFKPEQPLLMAPHKEDMTKADQYPAVRQWFSCIRPRTWRSFPPDEYEARRFAKGTYWLLKHAYFSPFSSCVLPYELIVPSQEDQDRFHRFRKFMKWHTAETSPTDSLKQVLTPFKDPDHVCQPDTDQFQGFHGPLELMLAAARDNLPTSAFKHGHRLQSLYIAQAQLRDLPEELVKDVPTPRLVLEAGKGDIYDANLWMGTPPTYTSLHKDPNPNLFVQLAGYKTVRIFKPEVGRAHFAEVQRKMGTSGSASIRGTEMMIGKERDLLADAVWNDNAVEGFEVVVEPGDALFIPKGWWHSIRSRGPSINASVNWWFR